MTGQRGPARQLEPVVTGVGRSVPSDPAILRMGFPSGISPLGVDDRIVRIIGRAVSPIPLKLFGRDDDREFLAIAVGMPVTRHPAQLRTCGTTAYGSDLGCMVSKRTRGNGGEALGGKPAVNQHLESPPVQAGSAGADRAAAARAESPAAGRCPGCACCRAPRNRCRSPARLPATVPWSRWAHGGVAAAVDAARSASPPCAGATWCVGRSRSRSSGATHPYA